MAKPNQSLGLQYIRLLNFPAFPKFTPSLSLPLCFFFLGGNRLLPFCGSSLFSRPVSFFQCLGDFGVMFSPKMVRFHKVKSVLILDVESV